MNIKDFVQYIPNALPIDLCDKIVETYQKSSIWKSHSWYNPKENKVKHYSNDCEILAPHECIELENVSTQYVDSLFEITKKFITNYCQQFDVQGMIKRHTYPRLNRYQIGTHMSPHFDHIQSIFDGEEKGIPILSAIGNLNRDYKGGELVFFRKDMLRMNVGDLVIFPSCFIYTHEVTTVEDGARYSYVVWSY